MMRERADEGDDAKKAVGAGSKSLVMAVMLSAIMSGVAPSVEVAAGRRWS